MREMSLLVNNTAWQKYAEKNLTMLLPSVSKRNFVSQNVFFLLHSFIDVCIVTYVMIRGENRIMFCAAKMFSAAIFFDVFNSHLFQWCFMLSITLEHKSLLKTWKSFDFLCCTQDKISPIKAMEDNRRFWHFWLHPFHSADKGWFFINYTVKSDHYFL